MPFRWGHELMKRTLPAWLATTPASASAFITQAIAEGGRVLVHCNGVQTHPHLFNVLSSSSANLFKGGISLSPAFAVMFVMQHYRASWEDALQYVQNRRYCISPNGGFLTQLKVRFTSLVSSLYMSSLRFWLGVRIYISRKSYCR